MILDRWCDVKVTEKNEKKKAKGQLISECLFDFFKKINNKFDKFLPQNRKSGQIIK